ncbi:hypothetical protein ElyMa_002425900 [Elysia marginata]|uniref:Uncharacterized protein n=1 Tax=Elysia marginata TaxID=1093978 RepID=A0AAV4GH38_9GAST|nr:hypothetical protein ElyMa_002425900 [Elysia marginata]
MATDGNDSYNDHVSDDSYNDDDDDNDDGNDSVIMIVMMVISETALGTIESVLPHCDVRSACIRHTQSHYPDTVPTRLSTKSIMPDTRRSSC